MITIFNDISFSLKWNFSLFVPVLISQKQTKCSHLLMSSRELVFLLEGQDDEFVKFELVSKVYKHFAVRSYNKMSLISYISR